MGSRGKTTGKSDEQIRREIIEDWADIRQWIDELQQEWEERQNVSQPPGRDESRGKKR